VPSQETLDSGHTKIIDPADHGLWNSVVDNGTTVNHHAWMRACATGASVGTCRVCGALLEPCRPDDLGHGRIDYEAQCRNRSVWTRGAVAGCGQIINAPGGRVLVRSARRSEQPQHWKG